MEAQQITTFDVPNYAVREKESSQLDDWLGKPTVRESKGKGQ